MIVAGLGVLTVDGKITEPELLIFKPVVFKNPIKLKLLSLKLSAFKI